MKYLKPSTTENGIWPVYAIGTNYNVGDIFKTVNTPTWGVWEVTKAGVSSGTPSGSSVNTTFTSEDNLFACKLVKIGSGEVFNGATENKDGSIGLVPKPVIGDETKFLRGDGTWQEIQGGGMSARIKVTTSPGAVVYCTDGVNPQTVVANANGLATFKIDELGDYTISAKKGNQDSANIETISVTTVKQYECIITFFEATIEITAPENTVVTMGEESQTVDNTGKTTFTVTSIGEYTFSGKLNGYKCKADKVVTVVSGTTTYAATLEFFSGSATVTSEAGSTITFSVNGGDEHETVLGDTGSVTISIYEAGEYTFKTSKDDIEGESKTVTISDSNKNVNVSLGYIYLAITSVAGASVTVSKGTYTYNVTLNDSASVTIKLPSTGIYSATAVYSADNDTVTKTATINATEYKTYTATLINIDAYAYYIDTNDEIESTCVHAVSGAANDGYAPIAMNWSTGTIDMGDWAEAFFMPKPCMLNSNGTVAYYLDPDDYTKKADGTASDVANTSFDGNAMMQWPCTYIKLVSTSGRLTVYVSSNKKDDEYECYPCLKADGTYANYFYTPIYNGSVVNGKMRSLSGQQVSTARNIDMQTQMNYATANGNGWNISTWCAEDLIRLLGILVMGRLNSQIAIGFGQLENYYNYTTGVGNSKGMFWGGSSTSAHANGTKFFGMENWWGDCRRRCVGLVTDSSCNYKYKNTVSTQDGSTATAYNTDGSGYKNMSSGLSSWDGYIKAIKGAKGLATVPMGTATASDTTGYCDYGYVYAGYALCVGCVADSDAGLFDSNLYYSASAAYSYLGASLSYHEL